MSARRRSRPVRRWRNAWPRTSSPGPTTSRRSLPSPRRRGKADGGRAGKRRNSIGSPVFAKAEIRSERVDVAHPKRTLPRAIERRGSTLSATFDNGRRVGFPSEYVPHLHMVGALHLDGPAGFAVELVLDQVVGAANKPQEPRRRGAGGEVRHRPEDGQRKRSDVHEDE